ncbi:hypothetical protein PRtIB026_A46160 [Pseudomonas sp. RtIB026]|uniref:phage tail assembly chaperone n=1 Tax=Pseudomonas sp. RtIB026 TaxID=2749999 RepID=UPI001942EAC4|nr:phage tail assembly chaperone [Pseudomonas sp. RtIB026]BCJ05585.1 hypothetical protein PRtIB026_A46160 [Pseudomonas sp. RtIB026]
MQRFYCERTRTTYLEGIHKIPADALTISDECYFSVIANPESGKIRVHEKGLPILIDPPPASSEEQAKLERNWRDSELDAVIWLRDRHRDQLEIGADTTLTLERFNELLIYMQALRDWPQSGDFPDLGHRPSAPLWLVEQTQ